MARVDVDDTTITVHLSPAEKVGGLSRSLHLARSSLRSARYVSDLIKEKRGLRLGGAGIPGRLYVGHFVGRGYRDFYAIHGRRGGLLMDFEGAKYDRVAVTLPDEVAKRLADQL